MTPIEQAEEALRVAQVDADVTSNAIAEAHGRRCAGSVMFRCKQAHQRAKERVRVVRDRLRYLRRAERKEAAS